MTARGLFWLGFSALLLTGIGCSNDSGSGTSSPALACTDAGAAGANAVNTKCAAALDAVTEQVDVVMGGPAAGTTNVGGLNFDVTYDASKLDFVADTTYTSPLFPTALVAVSLSQPGRVIASIQQTGGTTVAVGAGQHVALSLKFAKSGSAATFAATPIGMENTEATGASAAIAFSSAVALSYQ